MQALALLLLALVPAAQGMPHPADATYQGTLTQSTNPRAEPRYELHAGRRVYVLAFDPTDGMEAEAGKLVGKPARVHARGVYRVGPLDVLLVYWIDAIP
jgi:hypothetical protein